MIKKITSLVLVVGLFLVASGFLQINYANAGALSALSDTMSNQTKDANSSHTFKFTVATTMTAGQTIEITFPDDFNLTSSVFGNVTITHGDTLGTEHGSGVDETVAGSNGASTVWGAAFSGTENRVLTLTAPSGTWTNQIIADDIVIITLASTNALNPSTTGSKTITIATSSDTGSLAVPIVGGIEDNNVVITATVDPTITFTNDDVTIGFGTLSASIARYANGTTGSDNDTTAHTMTVATNGAGGYSLSYNGPTLTGTPTGTITALTAGITDDANGTPGQSQFGISGVMTGTGAMETGYDNSGAADWKFVASTPTVIAKYLSGPVASDSIAMHYLANISGATPAGSYTTTITYIATGNF